MIPKKQIVDNELMKEIISIRLDTLWRMLEQSRLGFLPEIHEEGATGKYDNKGAIFIPGGLIYQDVDERFIRYESYGQITSTQFREKIREAMCYDNATLLYPDGIAGGINLDGGFFSKAARRIFSYKKAAYRRTKRIGSGSSIEISSDEILKSHCPTYMKPPYGARTRISTCVSVGLIDPPMFFAYNKTELNFSQKQSRRFVEDLDQTREAPLSMDGKVLYPPYVIVCHDTRYKENSFTGLTRILGIGKFGEFATFSFEMLNKRLTSELKRKNQAFKDEDIFAEQNGAPIFGIIRVYNMTNPGKRSIKYQLHILSPEEDLEIDVGQAKTTAQAHYRCR
jgi:hypothetical protein